MIQISDKSQCCGCSSCAQRCPKGCITMVQDEEGFSYPQVDADTCIDCGLCEKVCPIINPKLVHEPLKFFAAKNPNEIIREESSSGGIFTMLAESIIKEGGVVFGAGWNKSWNVEHSYTETIEGLKAFRGSKYVQSNVSGSYKQAESFLKEGRRVLFSGTPCQIAGLKAFLRKEYDNLWTVECVCHGVPSPGLWQRYLAEITKGKQILSINHRDKKTGWSSYSFTIQYTDETKFSQLAENNLWMKGLGYELSTRPSCACCPSKIDTSMADITIGDLWGIAALAPGMNDEKGHCVLIVHTEKMNKLCNHLGIEPLKSFTTSDVAVHNPAIVRSFSRHPQIEKFKSKVNNGTVTQAIRYFTKDSIIIRVCKFIRRIKRRIL